MRMPSTYLVLAFPAWHLPTSAYTLSKRRTLHGECGRLFRSGRSQIFTWQRLAPSGSVLNHSKAFLLRWHQPRTSVSKDGQSATASRMSPGFMERASTVILSAGCGHGSPFALIVFTATGTPFG